MNLTVLGLDHDLQWRDPNGDLQKLLYGLLWKSSVELIAEEAYKLPTTVGQRLALQLGKPWLDIDMNDAERERAGIYEESVKGGAAPLFEKGEIVGVTGEYLTHVEEIREKHWVSQILRHKVGSAVVLCGSLHLSPLAKKLRLMGCNVDEVEVWKFDWYRSQFGAFEVFEEPEGRRWFELRDPKRG